jgi:hypothetical protein
VILAAILIAPAMADVTMSFRDMSILPNQYQTFHIYEVNANGTWDRGLYNSSSDALTLETSTNQSSAFILQFVPSTSDFWADPNIGIGQFFDNVAGHYQAYLTVLFLFALFCIAIYLARRK